MRIRLHSLPCTVSVGTGVFLIGVGGLLLARPDRGGHLFGLADAAAFARGLRSVG